MELIAVCSAGVTAYLLMAWFLGYPVEPALPRPRRRRQSKMRVWLRQAGVTATPQQFVATSIALGVAVFGVLWLVLRTWPVAVVPSLFAMFGPYMFYAQRRRTHLREVVVAWPDGLRDVAASLKVTGNLHRSLLMLANGGPPALRTAFSGYRANAEMLGQAAALELIRSQLADATSDRVLGVLVLAVEEGIERLGDVLTRLAADVAADVRLLEELKTSRAEPVLNARIMAAGPWALLAYLALQDGPYRDFYRSGAGFAVVIIALILTVLGLVWTQRLARDTEEPRVLRDLE
jgi:tight adherence protein B